MSALSPPGVSPSSLTGPGPCYVCRQRLFGRPRARSHRLVTSRLALIAGLCLGLGLQLSACSTPKIWPFYKKLKPVPVAVHELELVNADGTPASYAQYWKRNTLVIDLSG